MVLAASFSFGTLIAWLIVAGLVAICLSVIIKDHKKGGCVGCSCAGACSHCSGCAAVKKKKKFFGFLKTKANR
ncbi:MAG: hypothetical protein K6B75_03130 [Lachnospiraceae bacterium]|nr:hypothetical protein [Lachnospiraceae bacterium]